MDNVNIEERLRYSHEGGPLLGGLKGVARESSYTGSLEIVSYADFLVIKEALEQGQILLGKEITMIVAIRNSRDSLVVPLFASCTAKVKGTSGFADQTEMLRLALLEWNTTAAATHGDVISYFGGV